MKRTIISIAVLSMLLLSAGCAQTQTADVPGKETKYTSAETRETEQPRTEAAMPEEELATEPPAANGINPLTGESGYPDSAAGKRPIAVMVNNLAQAYPQYGIAAADVLYEVPVEGGVTRMMAVYADQDAVPDVGSVRSCRYYFPKLAMGMDAVYCHWGAEQFHAASVLTSLNIDRFDGGDLEHSLLFYRDPERVGKYSSEHTGYLRGADIPAALEQYGIRKYAVSRSAQFRFAEQPEAPAESVCVRAVIPFSESSSSGFIYDAETQTYWMEHNGSPQMDGKADTQLAFTNLFILQTEMGWLDETQYLRRVELEGGSGYYISCGGMETIRWEKEDDYSPIVFYASDGSELEINPGKSYIGIVDAARNLLFSAGV